MIGRYLCHKSRRHRAAPCSCHTRPSRHAGYSWPGWTSPPHTSHIHTCSPEVIRALAHRVNIRIFIFVNIVPWFESSLPGQLPHWNQWDVCVGHAVQHLDGYRTRTDNSAPATEPRMSNRFYGKLFTKNRIWIMEVKRQTRKISHIQKIYKNYMENFLNKKKYFEFRF